MANVFVEKIYNLTAPYLVDGVDATILGSQVWESTSAIVSIVPELDGSAIISFTDVGSATIKYTAKGNNGGGEVPLFGSIDLVIEAAPVQPVEVTIQVTEVN